MALNQLRGLPRRAQKRAIKARTDRADRRFVPQASYDAQAPAVILSPHPDDAVFNCWSVLEGERPVQVVNLFAGIPEGGTATWWDRMCGANDSAAQVAARRDEDRAVLEPLVGPPINLSLLEEQYRSTPRLPLAVLGASLSDWLSPTSLVYAPAALGAGHVDHRLTRGLARALARTGIPVRLYADVPYAVRYGWPQWVTGAQRDQAGGVDQDWAPILAEVPEIGTLRRARVVRLSPESAARKLAAMKAYQTQFTGLDSDGLLSDPRTHGHEVFWNLGGLPTDGAGIERPGVETCGFS